MPPPCGWNCDRFGWTFCTNAHPTSPRRIETGAAWDLDGPNGAVPYLQACNIWFQLMKIIDENAAMRDRRLAETRDGAGIRRRQLCPRAGTGRVIWPRADRLNEVMQTLSVGPTLTAHPTEAKRVTILEIHRRIYRGLVSLEEKRWTPRERADLLEDLRSEIDLLWLTGELRRERPSLNDEIQWGLQFFRDSLFDAVPQLFDRFLSATAPITGQTRAHMRPASGSIPGSAATATATPMSRSRPQPRRSPPTALPFWMPMPKI